MNDIVKIIETYWQYLSIVAGLILTYLGVKIISDRNFLNKLMSKGRIWEHEENKLFTEQEASNYNKGRGIQIALIGIIFMVLGVVSL